MKKKTKGTSTFVLKWDRGLRMWKVKKDGFSAGAFVNKGLAKDYRDELNEAEANESNQQEDI